MIQQSIQKKLTRVRPPRLQSSYDVEIGHVIELNELPFIPSPLGRLTSHATGLAPRFGDCRFVDVNADNFDSVLKSMKPRNAFQLEDSPIGDLGVGNLPPNLNVPHPEDFEGGNIGQQIRPLDESVRLDSNLSGLPGTLPKGERPNQMWMEAGSNTSEPDNSRSAINGSSTANEEAEENQDGRSNKTEG